MVSALRLELRTHALKAWLIYSKITTCTIRYLQWRPNRFNQIQTRHSLWRLNGVWSLQASTCPAVAAVAGNLNYVNHILLNKRDFRDNQPCRETEYLDTLLSGETFPVSVQAS
jgi:hypothetical protein